MLQRPAINIRPRRNSAPIPKNLSSSTEPPNSKNWSSSSDEESSTESDASASHKKTPFFLHVSKSDDVFDEVPICNEVDVVIVGGGPIGLAHAFGLKKLNPSLNVVLLEKSIEHKRKRTLLMCREQLRSFMRATNAESEQDLKDLLGRLKADPRIQMDELTRIFNKLAKAKGVDIQTKELNTVQENDALLHLLPKYKPRLIIFADGARSRIGRRMFDKGNQIKHEFDYILRFKYEIDGEVKTQYDRFIDEIDLSLDGIVASEHIGEYRNGCTPVTLQLMVTKKEFLSLRIDAFRKLLNNNSSDESDEDFKAPLRELQLSERLEGFFSAYIAHRVGFAAHSEVMNRIQVNAKKAYAMHAKNIYGIWQQTDKDNSTNEWPVLLVGDAALNLSYFKGFNAGLEAATQLMSLLAPSIKSSSNIRSPLRAYRDWFLDEFLPTNVMSVAKSSNVIRMDENRDAPLYPHRSHELVQFAELDYVPITYTIKKIAKLFADFVKPYKSAFQVGRDFSQPFIGLANIVMGLTKIVVGIFTLNFMLPVDGLFRILRGLLEVATTPLAWLMKPIFRLIATGVHETPSIENGDGMRRLAELGFERLNDAEHNTRLSTQEIQELLAVCHDLHRKFDKGYQRAQKTEIPVKERTLYNSLSDKNNPRLEGVQEIRRYFSLFAKDVRETDKKHGSKRALQMSSPRSETPRLETPRAATPRTPRAASLRRTIGTHS